MVDLLPVGKLGECQLCGERSPLISSQLGVCLRCIRERPEEALEVTDRAHAESRGFFGLPPRPPREPNGVLCGMCANNCVIGEGERGFCGLISNIDGKLVMMGGTVSKGVLEWYYDPLPTNCVAWWFCPGCTGAGYPRYAYKPDVERGYANLAVFYGSCNLDCLFCQNWHYRYMSARLSPTMSAENLARKVNSHVSCICFFGGDPSVQMPHAIRTSQLALEEAGREGRILRICWESNGNWRREFALKAAELSFESGGIVKFDLKAWDENIYRALCGVPNSAILENFRVIGERYFDERREVPVLTASTLLVPGYIDVEEVRRIAEFISGISPDIPYSLLAFYPQYRMRDLPTTSRRLAYECYNAAKRYLRRVRIGNIHLLS
ncbi:radical SAM protein [Candidatus Bathyarchaeota archaeon]|nr:MAG: radical SAM protein [Candidatus Bathyarchaeota archaeon]